jgi:four helix bundle protein
MEKHTIKSDPLREKTFKLAIRVVKLYQYLTKEKHEFTMSKQLLRAGTNPGAMVREAANAESGSDFIHKLCVAQKETGETLYWLELLHRTDYLTTNEFDSMNADADKVMKLLRSSILTKKKNLAIKTVSVISIILFTINYFL